MCGGKSIYPHITPTLRSGCMQADAATSGRQRDNTLGFSGLLGPLANIATLIPAQELVVIALRKTLLLPLDDLLAVTREFLNPAVLRSGLDHCLRRHGVSNLQVTIPQPEGDEQPRKTSKRLSSK